MILKEPKRLIAVVLLIYIVFSIIMLVDNFSKEPESITGLNTRGVVTINIIRPCSITLQQGYNFISLCANATNRSITNVLGSIAGKYEFILRWNRTSQQFDTFSPEASSNSFDKFEYNESYFIFVDENSNLNILGNEFNDVNISLTQEFNAPAYPYFFTSNISRYIDPIKENVSFVLKWDPANQSFKVFSPEAAQQEFDMIDKGEGQFIFLLSQNTVLRYNKTLLKS